MEYEIFGMDNPIMDILMELDEEQFVKYGLRKGSFNKVSEKEFMKIQSDLFNKNPILSPGGSIANTLSAFSLLGGKAFFCGKVGNDDFANKYKLAMEEIGVKTWLPKADALTGRALTMVTPDKERTFAVHLGAALTLKKEDLDLESIKKSKSFHVGGYLLEEPNLRDVAIYALDFAKKNKKKISIDLADPGIIKRTKKIIKGIIRDYADIVFANEEEAIELTGMLSAEDSLEELSKMCEIAVVKLGKRGSLIRKGKKVYKIEGVTVNAVDTTGAGDAYAGSFLYAFNRGHSLETSGKLASFIAAAVVSQMGARLKELPDISGIINRT